MVWKVIPLGTHNGKEIWTMQFVNYFIYLAFMTGSFKMSRVFNQLKRELSDSGIWVSFNSARLSLDICTKGHYSNETLPVTVK